MAAGAVVATAVGFFPGRSLSPEDAAAVRDVLDAAAAWAAGELGLWEAAEVGAMAYGDPPSYSPGRGRFVARWSTPPDEPRLPALAALIDELVALAGTPTDAAGRIFASAEIAGVERRIAYDGPVARVVFTGDFAAVTAWG